MIFTLAVCLDSDTQSIHSNPPNDDMMSLRFRLNLLIALLLLVFMSAVGFVVIKGMRSTIQEGVESANRVSVQLLDTVILSAYQNPEWGFPHEVLQRFLYSLGHVRSSEITLADVHGNVLYKSPQSTYHSDQTPPEWFAEMLTPEKEVVERRIKFAILTITSNPGGAIREAWGRFKNLMWIGISFFVGLNIVVYWMLGRWLKPIQPMLVAINQMEKGDLSIRLPNFDLPEFSQIAHSFNQMGESLQASTEESYRLALIVKQTADAIMIHDLNGNISFWNPAAQRMFGYAPEDIIGKSASLLMPANTEAELAKDLATIAGKEKIEQYDTQRITREGALKDISLSAAPLIDPRTGAVIGEICSMRDITERKEAEAAAQELEANRQLTQLIQRHIEDERRSLARELHDELGQYVTAIKTFAVGISNKVETKMPDIAANAQTIVAAANHIYDGMHNIIRQLRPGSLDNLGLSETLRDSINIWQTQHPEIHFTIELNGELNGLGETVNINIYRIVQESVTNALRHAQATEIAITLNRTNDNTLILAIKDNGVGMNICNVDQTQHFGLLGMRERAQALDGKFTVDSALEQGSVITVTIPVQPTQSI